MRHFDVAVIGAGPAGFAAAVRAWDYGKNVALIERGPLGGTGIHNGALSSKTLWELSRDYRNAIRRDRGYIAHSVDLDFAQVRHAVQSAVAEKQAQLEHQLAVLASESPGLPGRVELLRGTASFVDDHHLFVEGTEQGEQETIEADFIVIATGSRPRALPSLPIDGQLIMTSDHVMRLEAFPRSLVIVGAGVVGCEFATVFANYERTKVYLIDRKDRILPFEDEDISSLCAANLEAHGVTIHRGARLTDMHVVDDQVEYTISYGSGAVETIRVDRALISIGREPNLRGLGLDKAGVALCDRNHIQATATQTNVPHIHAVGDVTFDIALVSIGEIEGRHAIDSMFGAPKPLSFDNVSTIMFLDPEVALVGLNEQQAQERRIPYRVAVYGYNLVNRAIAMRATAGFIKLLVSDDDELRLLGMRALGVHASTTIEAVALLIHQGGSVRDVAEMLHPHPAMTEALQDCARMLLGSSIHKPHAFTSDLRLSRIRYDTEAE